jgi:predicted ATPase/DNA-binding CsgD family transcriptional regulator
MFMTERMSQRLGNYHLNDPIGSGAIEESSQSVYGRGRPQGIAPAMDEREPVRPTSLPSLAEAAIEADQASTALGNSHIYAQKMPVSLTRLIGREKELQAAYDRLSRSEVQLLTLTGLPGVGKTLLALTLGELTLEEFAEGVCFVSLASISDPDQVISTIICTLGLRESRGYSPFEQLVDYLRDKQLLLLLDNFEHLLPAASMLSELLLTCPQLKLLVTSRATLHVQGEYEFAVPPLAIPNLQSLPAHESLSQIEAVELFVQCAEAHKPGFTLTEDNATVIAEICVRLEGLPLAIELAAALCKLLSLEELLSRLEHRLVVLTGGKQDAPIRQQTLRDTIAWSYDLLSVEKQMLFAYLSVFEGDFTLDAAEAVVAAVGGLPGSVLEGMVALVDSSLVQQREEEGNGSRLHILEALREYGLERLAAQGELERCRDAHADYYLALTEQAESALAEARNKPGENAFAAAWEAGTPQEALEAELQILSQTEVLSIPPATPHLIQSSPIPVISHGLTAREVEVLRLVSTGMSNNQIAEQLVLSPNTVNAHIQSIYRKVDVNSRSGATRFAMEHQLI